jgi:hypothetical protein
MIRKATPYLVFLLGIVLGCQDKIQFKEFKSDRGWLSLCIPTEWERHMDEDEGTYAFYNPVEWKGTFRITPMKWTRKDSTGNKSEEFISSELSENEGAKKIQIGDWVCAHYKKQTIQEGEELTIYYWATGKQNDLFLCTFTIDRKDENSERSNTELSVVKEVIKSIKRN